MHENPAIALWEYWHISQQMRNPKIISDLKDQWKTTRPSVREQESYEYEDSRPRKNPGFSLDYRCSVRPHSLCAPYDDLGEPDYQADIEEWLPVYRLYQHGTPILTLWPDGRFIVHTFLCQNTLFKYTFLATGYLAGRRQVLVESLATSWVRMYDDDFITSRRWYMGWHQLCSEQSYRLLPFEHGGWRVVVDTANGDLKRMASALGAMKYANKLRDFRYKRAIRKSPSYRRPPTPLTTRALPDAIKSIKVYEPA